MAAVAEEGCKTELCSNCKKEIPEANFTIHEIHCHRNIGVCYICKEPFPKSELRDHHEQEHTQVFCKCSMKMDRGLLQEHMASECPLRLVTCQHCDIELAFNKLQEHEDYCGARTERCSRCNRNIMLRDLKKHPQDCGKKAEEERICQAQPALPLQEAVWQNIQTIQNVFHQDAAAGPLLRASRIPESRLYNCLSREQLPREFGRRSIGPTWGDQNQAHVENITTSLTVDGKQNYDLDYMLALSLQQEDSSHKRSAAEIQSDIWKNISPGKNRSAETVVEAKEPSIFSQDIWAPNALNRPQTETLLPCEFCEELYPEEELILHQTGCNPNSSLASFRKRRNFVPQSECFRGLWVQLQNTQSVGSREVPPLRRNSCGSLMLPCEFCGIQLEEEILFHHQDQCDLRPATAPLLGKMPAQQGTLAMNNVERAEAPDLTCRRIRHQVEISPQYLEKFSQQKLPLAVRESQSQNNLVATQRFQLTSPDNKKESNIGPTKGGKPRGGRQTPSWCPSDPSAALLPARQSPFNFPPSSYKPSFPETAPTRSSLSNEGGRSPNRRTDYKTEAEPDYPDKE